MHGATIRSILVHLVGFIIRIFHAARSHERHMWNEFYSEAVGRGIFYSDIPVFSGKVNQY